MELEKFAITKLSSSDTSINSLDDIKLSEIF